MIGKIITGKSFGGCIAYNLNRQEAFILDSCGVRTSSIKHLTDDFNMQRSLNSNLHKAVGHIILSWSVMDKSKIDDRSMVSVAREYMDKMKISDTQFLLVRHTDRDHPHLHLIYNRVDNNGKTLPDRFQKLANIKACKEITLKYEYHIAQGKANVNRHRLTGSDKVKYEIHDAVRKGIHLSNNWQRFVTALKDGGIETHFKYLSNTDQVQGISFSKNGYKFKGSEIDRGLSYGKICAHLQSNMESNILDNELQVKRDKLHVNNQAHRNAPDLVETLLGNQQQQDLEVPFELRRTKRKLRKGHRL